MKKLLLLHGALGAKSQLNELEKLLKSSFEVHSIDFTGHGLSDLPAEPFSIQMFAADIEKWVAEKNSDSIDIFGYSMGGYAALYFAKHHPGRVGKIFTLATKFEWSPETAAREVKMLDAVKIREKVPKFAEELGARHGTDKWEKLLEKTAGMMRELGSKNALTPEDIAGIKNEVMLGIGDRDKMVTLEETIAVYRQLKTGKLIVLPGTPHPLEQVDVAKLAGEIKSFFE